jgi:hypothetical protein
MKHSGIVLDSPDARQLAAFCRRLLGWTVEQDEPGWIKLRAPDGGPELSFRPRRLTPGRPGQLVPAISNDGAPRHCGRRPRRCRNKYGRCGSRRGVQPEDDNRVYLDPAGHPFCLFLAG